MRNASRCALGLAVLALAGCAAEDKPPTPPPPVAEAYPTTLTTLDGYALRWNAEKCLWQDSDGHLVVIDHEGDAAAIRRLLSQTQECEDGLAFKKWHARLGIKSAPTVKVRRTTR